MNAPNGYNPMRWNCAASGCFNTVMRPKIEVFADYFPGCINFSDVDGIVEINGFFVLLEWKSSEYIPRGQELLYDRITRSGRTTVYVVCGNAQTMELFSVAMIWEARNYGWQSSSLELLKQEFAQWSAWAKRGGRP